MERAGMAYITMARFRSNLESSLLAETVRDVSEAIFWGDLAKSSPDQIWPFDTDQMGTFPFDIFEDFAMSSCGLAVSSFKYSKHYRIPVLVEVVLTLVLSFGERRVRKESRMVCCQSRRLLALIPNTCLLPVTTGLRTSISSSHFFPSWTYNRHIMKYWNADVFLSLTSFRTPSRISASD